MCDHCLFADVIRDGRLLYPTKETELRTCYWHAMAAYSAIRLFGGSGEYFNNEKTPTCDYEPGLHAARDQVISGRFERGAPERTMVLTELPDGGLALEISGFESGLPVTRLQQTITPSDVAAADADRWCKLAAANGQPVASCPGTLADRTFDTSNWFRQAPVVIDSDGDGVDEVLLFSATQTEGLILTHFKTAGWGADFRLEPPKAYLAADEVAHFLPRNTDDGVHIMERAVQRLVPRPLVLARAPPGCGELVPVSPEDVVMVGSYAQQGRLAFSHAMIRFLL